MKDKKQSSKISKLKLKVEPKYKIFRRTTKDHPWRLICSTDVESMARASYGLCSTRYPGQEIRIEGFSDVSNVGDTVKPSFPESTVTVG